jgi:hypothetical protein
VSCCTLGSALRTIPSMSRPIARPRVRAMKEIETKLNTTRTMTPASIRASRAEPA